MIRITKRKENKTDPPILAVSKRFGMYKDEEKKAVLAPDVKKDEVLERIKEEWAKLDPDRNIGGRYIDGRAAVWSMQIRLDISPEDVERFSLVLAEFQDEEAFSVKAGTFLSALINRGKYSDYVIHTGHLTNRIDVLGFENEKNILVRGNVGNAVGGHMKKGLLVIEGDVTTRVGVVMKDGLIEVMGNAGAETGYSLNGGKIMVKGNSGDKVGDHMIGGEIHIEGKIGSIGKVVHGKIFHKGKLIVDK